jgi:hypothetical protein
MSFAQSVASSPSSLERSNNFVGCSVSGLTAFTGKKQPTLLCRFHSRVVSCFVGYFKEAALSVGLPHSHPRWRRLVAFSQEICRLAPALSVTSSPSLERRSHFVGCYVAFFQEMTPLCLLHYLSLCRLLGNFFSRDDADVSDVLLVTSSPSLAKRSRFVAHSTDDAALSPVLLVALSVTSSLFLKR